MNLVEQLYERVRTSPYRKRIVIIGDAMTDHWIQGRLEGCQDGCTKLMTESLTTTPGGAANAMQCLRHWPVNMSLYSYPDEVWPRKFRLVDPSGKIVYRFDDETSLQTVCRDESTLRHGWQYNVVGALNMVRHAAGVLLSDYGKGFLTPEVVAEVVGMCKARGIPCVADCNRPPALYDGCVLKCNSDYQKAHNRELSRLIYDADGEPCQQSLVVTAGPLNPAVWDMGVLARTGPFLPPVRCVNHVGAGDCFAAHLVLGLAYGMPLTDAATVANSAGRVYVQHPRNRAPAPVEVAGDLGTTAAGPAVRP